MRDRRNDVRENNEMQDPTTGDGIDRRDMLKCMAWVGTGLLWSVQGGVASSRAFGQARSAAAPTFTFAQISDSHLGFNRDPNHDVAGTFRRAVERINALPEPPDFLLHTGDLTHLAKPAEFDAVAEILKGVKAKQVFYVPGEHDFDGDGNKEYLARFGKGASGAGWYSFDHRGVHFVGLVNAAAPKSGTADGGLGVLGAEQLAWLEKDLAGLVDSVPIVVFAHVPLWTVYEKWGWGTRDPEQALQALRRFGSLTVLNGHIHQAMRKIEGNVAFHTARSTAFPQAEPGKGTPGPLRGLKPERLLDALGLAHVSYVATEGALAVVDETLR